MNQTQAELKLEKADIDVKCQALSAFLTSTDALTHAFGKLKLLDQQLAAMVTYSNVLGLRIADSTTEEDDFPIGKACDLSGDGTCEACQ